jgi:hypothetical protein
MIRIDSNADGTVRVDGLLAPPQHCRVEMTLVDGPPTTDADVDVRFAFLSVPRDTARIVVRQAGQVTGESKPGPVDHYVVDDPVATRYSMRILRPSPKDKVFLRWNRTGTASVQET